MDLGFKKAPRNVRIQKPQPPAYSAIVQASPAKSISKSLRPKIRPENNENDILIATNEYRSDILSALKQAQIADKDSRANIWRSIQIYHIVLSLNLRTISKQLITRRTISRLTSSGQKDWGIDIGTYPNRFTADKVLIKTALSEMISLEGSLRKVVKNKYGFRATFLGLRKIKQDKLVNALETET